MAIDTTIPRARRAILLGAVGGLAAAFASAIGRASPVAATDNETVQVGHTYSATTTTRIDATGGADAIYGTSDSGNGVEGYSGSGYGVHGQSAASIGVYGFSNTYVGVYGISYAPD